MIVRGLSGGKAGGDVLHWAPMTAAAAAAATAATDKEHVRTPCMMHAHPPAGRRAANAHRYLELIRLNSACCRTSYVGAGRSHRRAFYRQRPARDGEQR